MIKFEFTEVVARPAEEVFDYLTDAEKLPESGNRWSRSHGRILQDRWAWAPD
jgi:uncharacterized protein YndB with AHSA1/START domain